MRKLILLAICLSLLPVIIQARTLWRWINIPRHRPPQIHKTRLGGSAFDTTAIPFTHEPKPVSHLLPKINRSIPEASAKKDYSARGYLPQQSSIVIEELTREAINLLDDEIIQQQLLDEIMEQNTKDIPKTETEQPQLPDSHAENEKNSQASDLKHTEQ